jgi:hypothetical protein
MVTDTFTSIPKPKQNITFPHTVFALEISCTVSKGPEEWRLQEFMSQNNGGMSVPVGVVLRLHPYGYSI